MAALSGAVRLQTQIASRLGDLGDVLGKIQVNRSISFRMTCRPTSPRPANRKISTRWGNLLDNAFMWARTSVVVRASINDGMVRVVVDDDGPGLTRAQRDAVLKPGKRLDEAAPGLALGYRS
jgi:signal transduction histidine kinase